MSSQLKEKFESIEGFNNLFKGIFARGKAKKSYELYKSCDIRGVAKNEILRVEEHDDSYYAIMAFSLKGDIPVEIKQELVLRSQKISLGEIRYDAHMFRKLSCWARNYSSGNYSDVANFVGEGYEDICVFVAMHMKSKKIICDYVLYGIKDDEIYLYPFA